MWLNTTTSTIRMVGTAFWNVEEGVVLRSKWSP